MSLKKISSQVDYGAIQWKGRALSDLAFESCGLSLGFIQRSHFDQCNFQRIVARKCSVGFPVFERCRFRDIGSDKNGLLVYGAGFSECEFEGTVKNVVIGFMSDVIAGTEENRGKASTFQQQNIALAGASAFAIDLTRAQLEHVAIRGEEIIPFVRCAPKQALVLKSDRLFEKLVELGRTEENRPIGDFFLSAGVPGCSVALAITNEATRNSLSSVEQKLARTGIEFTHF